jgi:pimeloyl-ACP methyl ester carboxylesterase
MEDNNMNISIKMLGELKVYHNGEEVPLPKSKRTRALLAYLALTDRPHRRDRLCELFWVIPDDPKGALRWSLSKIRPIVNDLQLTRLVADRERVTLLTQDIALDVRNLLSELDTELSSGRLEDIFKLLQDPLLEGCELPNQSSYQHWLESERNAMKAARNDISIKLALHPNLSPEKQLQWIKTALRQKPLNLKLAEKLLNQLDSIGYVSERKKLTQSVSEIFKGAGIKFPSNSTEVSELHDISSTDVVNREMLIRQKVKFCTTNDHVRIAYASIGQGHTIVKTANWLSHLEHDWNAPIWSPLFRELAKDHHFVRYDERGNGLSDWNVKELSFKTFVEDLETVISVNQLNKFALLGISQGASVAIEYAIKCPEKVSHLILFGGYAAGWRINASEAQIKEREAIMTLTKAGWGQDNPAYRQIFSSTFMPSANQKELDWFNEFQRLTTTPANAVRFLSVFGDIDVRHQLSKIRVPTLVIHSLGDQRIPLDVGRDIASQIPNAEFLGLESDGHLLLAREPASKLFVQAIRDFISNN